jgi:hypothetical protein
MELFKYNPTPYVNTQVDLPLDFIQGQLETRQKEFDAQTLAVDKAAENFMKINPGMLTKDAYDRVKKQYLPEIEKIRDTLHQTGNIAMAAPALSKFTMNLAADPQVKNIMEDYKLTEAYNKNLQEGKYTDKVFAGLFDAEGKQRAQLDEDEMTSASYYNPMQYTDPVASLLEEAKVFKANTMEDIISNPNKYGLIQTDSVTVENLSNELVRQWANDRLPTWKQNPENQAYFWNATGFKPETFTPEMWDENVAKNIADLVSYKKISKDRNFTVIPAQPTITPPSPNQNKTKTAAEEAATKTSAPASRFVINAKGKETGLTAYEQNKYPENVISNLYEFEDDLQYTKSSMQKSYNDIVALSNGAIPAGLDVASGKGGSRTTVRNWVNDNYTKNKYGEWVVKSATAPPITPEISAKLNGFTEANYVNNAKETLINDLKIKTGVKKYDKAKIYDAYMEAMDEFPITNMWGDNRTLAEKIEEQRQKINKRVPELLKGTEEGKIHKAFENFRNKLGEYQLTNLPGDGKFPEYEKQLINMALAGQLKGLTNILNGEDAASDDGLEAFTEAVPYVDGDSKKGIDTEQISLSMGYSPSQGVVGVIAMNGKYHEFDLDSADLDKQFTSEYPQLTQELRIYRDISASVKRSSNTEGSFNIGNIPFKFDVKTKNIGTDNPEFYYEFMADGVNVQKYTNVGQIIAIASDIASQKLDDKAIIVYGIQKDIAEEAQRRIAALPINTPPEVAAQIAKQADIDMKEAELEVNKVYNANNKPIGKPPGKQKQFRQTPKTPLQ